MEQSLVDGPFVEFRQGFDPYAAHVGRDVVNVLIDEGTKDVFIKPTPVGCSEGESGLRIGSGSLNAGFKRGRELAAQRVTKRSFHCYDAQRHR